MSGVPTKTTYSGFDVWSEEGSVVPPKPPTVVLKMSKYPVIWFMCQIKHLMYQHLLALDVLDAESDEGSVVYSLEQTILLLDHQRLKEFLTNQINIFM